jgi:membrane-associated phospholipid phosphatase
MDQSLKTLFIIALLYCNTGIASENICFQQDSIPTNYQLTSSTITTPKKNNEWKLPTGMLLSGIAFATIPPFHNIEKSIYEGFNKKPINKTNVDDYIQYAPAAATFMLDAFGVKGKHRIGEKFILYATGNMLAASIVHPTKYFTHRERPNKSNFLAFPSGHTSTAFVAAELLHQEYGHLSPWISAAGYGTAAFTGYLRLQNNVHWLGDVVAGAAIGMAATKISYWLLPKIKKGIKRKKAI